MPALRPVAHEFTHVNERARCRMIIRLGVNCSKFSWFGGGLCRLLRPCRQRPPSYRAAEKRNELASFQLIDLHPLPLARPNSITDWQASSQGLAAVRDFDPAYDRFGSKCEELALSISCPLYPR